MTVHDYDTSTQEAEAGKLPWVQEQPSYGVRANISWSYRMRLYLKKKKKNTEESYGAREIA